MTAKKVQEKSPMCLLVSASGPIDEAEDVDVVGVYPKDKLVDVVLEQLGDEPDEIPEDLNFGWIDLDNIIPVQYWFEKKAAI